MTNSVNVASLGSAMSADSSNNVSVTSGNLSFSSTGQRIRGDFSNATFANRVAFQTSTTNSPTTVYAIPNGTSTTSGFIASTDPSVANGSEIRLIVNGTTTNISSSFRGTGTTLPLAFDVGSEKMRIDTSGNVGIGTNSPNARLAVNGGTSTSQIRWEVSNSTYTQEVSTNAAVNAYVYKSNDASYHIWKLSNSQAMTLDANGYLLVGTTSPTYITYGAVEINHATNSSVILKTGDTTKGYLFSDSSSFRVVANSTTPMLFYTNGSERMRIDSSGAIGIGGANYGTSGQVLTSNGSGAAPSWQTAGGGVTSFNGNTGALNGWQKITSGSFSSATSVSIGSLPSGYTTFRLVANLSTNSSTFYPALRVSTDSGSSYISTNVYNTCGIRSDGAGVGAVDNTNASSMYATSFYWAGNGSPYIDFYLFQYGSGTNTRATGNFISGNAENDKQYIACGCSTGQTSYINGLQIIRTNGTGVISGTYTVYGSK